MNVHMYENKRTQHNLATLSSDGYYFLEPGEGFLACGYVAKGRMEEPLQIVERLNQYFKNNTSTTKNSRFNGIQALVTAGRTIEELDPVRYLSNRSSGKMGYALAESLGQRGATVTLISGPTHLSPTNNVEVIQRGSAQERFGAVKTRFDKMDIVLKSGAVSYYAPTELLEHRLKKRQGNLTVSFKRTPGILKYLGEHKDKQF